MGTDQACPLSREAFFQQLAARLSSTDAMVGLLVIDIHRFSRINDSFGYQVGDELLLQFAARLCTTCRKQDSVARLGDNRFAVILPGIAGEGQAMLAANKFLSVLASAFELEAGTIITESFIGIALSPMHGQDGELLLLKAEHALAATKQAGASYLVYSEASAGNTTFGWKMENELDEAIENNELNLHFQPKISLKDGRVYGAEALVRWRSPTRGDIAPDVFVAVAEETGRIQRLTQWVLNTALHRALEWPMLHGELSVSVNLSAKIAHDEELGELVRSAISLWGIGEHRVIIEITENELMRDPEGSYVMLSKLKDSGIGISIDDFGTGYSSLAYFKKLPASELKIDKVFVMNMLKNRGDREIVRLAIQLAHSFGFKVVAEGIETPSAQRALTKLGCDYGQGYYIARPMAQEEFIAWLKS
ncbi:MAG: hypothetical protein A2V90_09820, partial [Gammaproteobacteria bacterium RBG_16_57_12]